MEKKYQYLKNVLKYSAWINLLIYIPPLPLIMIKSQMHSISILLFYTFGACATF